MAKGQDYFCPISGVIPKAKVPNPDDVGLWLKVGGCLFLGGGEVWMMWGVGWVFGGVLALWRAGARGEFFFTLSLSLPPYNR